MEQVGDALHDQPRRLIRTAIHLSWFTIAYNLVEGFVSIGFGVAEGSVALAGFGIDSLIEVTSAGLVLWRFRGESGMAGRLSLERERRATLGIGYLFLVLATMTLLGSVIQLARRSHPGTTVPGLVIAGLSLSFMFYLWSSKKRVGAALGSATVLADAGCSLACIILSGVLFVGSLLYLAAPSFWWADSVAAVALALLIAKEGKEMIEAAKRPDFKGGCCDCD